MADEHTFYNTSGTALVFDSQGHVLEPEGRVSANPNATVVKALTSQGLLIDQGPTQPDGQDEPPADTPEPAAPDAAGDGEEE